MEDSNTANMLSILDRYTLETAEDISKKLADDFRQRRIEKNLTRKQIAAKANISLSNLTRFEQKGLISLSNLIALAMALGYTHEIKSIFESPKYATMDELTQIRHNMGKKRAYNNKR